MILTYNISQGGDSIQFLQLFPQHQLNDVERPEPDELRSHGPEKHLASLLPHHPLHHRPHRLSFPAHQPCFYQVQRGCHYGQHHAGHQGTAKESAHIVLEPPFQQEMLDLVVGGHFGGCQHCSSRDVYPSPLPQAPNSLFTYYVAYFLYSRVVSALQLLCTLQPHLDQIHGGAHNATSGPAHESCEQLDPQRTRVLVGEAESLFVRFIEPQPESGVSGFPEESGRKTPVESSEAFLGENLPSCLEHVALLSLPTLSVLHSNLARVYRVSHAPCCHRSHPRQRQRSQRHIYNYQAKGWLTVLRPQKDINIMLQRGERDEQLLSNKRDEQAQKGRRARREEFLQKRRNVAPLSAEQSLDINIMAEQEKDSPSEMHQHLRESPHKALVLSLLEEEVKPSQLLGLLAIMKNRESSMQSLLQAAIGVRKILCDESNCPVQSVVDANGVPILLHFMMDTREPHLQLECAWSLTNIVCGTSQQTKSVVQQKGIQCFIQLLHHRYHKVIEQAVWALGNIAGDSHIFRDQILNSNAVAPLCQLVMNESTPRHVIHQAVWTLSNLCRGRPFPEYSLCKDTVPIFCRVISHINNYAVLSDAAWALSQLSDGDSSRIQAIINTGVVPRLVQLLTSPMVSVQIPAMRILGNLMTGNDSQTDVVLNNGVLPQLFLVLQSDNPAIRREVMWNVSNVAAGTYSQISLIFDQPEYVNKLNELLENDVMEVQEETILTIRNAVVKGNQNTLMAIHKGQIMKSLISLMKHKFVQVLLPGLECIMKMLAAGKQLRIQGSGQPGSVNNLQSEDNLFLMQFQQLDGCDNLEHLQSHPSEKVYLISQEIIEEYFEVEDDQY